MQYKTDHVCMFDTSFSKYTLDGTTAAVIKLAQKKTKGLVVTPNVDFIITLKRDPDFHAILQRASLVTADGMPLVWLSKILPGNSLPERVTGADLLFSVCEMAAEHHLSVAFVGGLPGIAEKAKDQLIALNPQLNVAATHCPPFDFEHNAAQSMEIIALCQTIKPDILFFGVGCPKQEKWCDKHLHQLHTGPILCIGAAFDFAAGNINRAPNWMRASGIEWLYRLAQEPGRLWKRYLLRDSLFLYYAIQEICIAWGKRIFQIKNM